MAHKQIYDIIGPLYLCVDKRQDEVVINIYNDLMYLFVQHL